MSTKKYSQKITDDRQYNNRQYSRETAHTLRSYNTPEPQSPAAPERQPRRAWADKITRR